MKLVFAGLGRSGTTSIMEALSYLEISTLSQDTVFPNRSLHTHLNAVLRGDEEINWEIFDGIEATIGWPLCWLYQEQLAHFPEAKCVLNVRDAESWFDSVTRAWKTLAIIRNARFIPRLRPMQETLDYLQEFCGGPPEKERWIAAYERHVAEVKQHVDPERLIVYRVQEGWEPLCQLLDLPVPDQPFPRSNVGGKESLAAKLRQYFGVG